MIVKKKTFYFQETFESISGAIAASSNRVRSNNIEDYFTPFDGARFMTNKCVHTSQSTMSCLVASSFPSSPSHLDHLVGAGVLRVGVGAGAGTVHTRKVLVVPALQSVRLC